MFFTPSISSFNHQSQTFVPYLGYSYKLENPEEKALEYYANTIRPEIKKLFPEGKDKTTIINGTIFVSKDQKAVKGYSTVFKKVLGKFRDYSKLEHIDYDFKSQLFESFLKESISKKNWGQFFTPLKVVKAIVEMAKDEIKEGSKICDPACGVGKFLLEPVKTKLDQFYEIKKGKLIPKITIHGFDKGFDKDEQKTIILAKANMLIYFSDLIKDNPTITEDFSDLFNDSFHLKTNSILGTLSDATENYYDLILTNPPYVTSGSSNLKEEISKDTELKNYYKINAMGVEGLFMEWIVRALKPNGKAFVVVPDGIFTRQNDKNLRKFILDECIIDGIISLPLKTFFTTPKKTYILCLTKKANKKEIQTEPVFTYLVSEIGESRDVYRFDIEQNDLEEAVNLYSFFKGNKTNFEKINKDPRCKIQLIEKFNPEVNWSIDRWWAKEEKISLGIEEEDKSIKFEELPELIEEVANNILSFKEEILEVSQKKKFKSEIKHLLIGEVCDSPPTNSGLKKLHVNLEKTEIHKIPVYSASKEENLVFGWVEEKSRWRKYENLLTWNKDGSANCVFYRKEKFIPYEKVKLLKIKDKLFVGLLYEYLKVIIQKRLIKEGFDFNRKCSMERVLKLDIPVPFDENGNIDAKRQEEIIEKYQCGSELKSKIENYKKQIQELNVEIGSEYQVKDISLNQVFDFPSIKGLTKEFINSNLGDIPVYGGKQFEAPVGFIQDNLPNVKYFENCLAWNREGSVGYVFFHKHKFTTNDHHRPLILKDDYKNQINLDYVRLFLEKLLLSQGFAWSKTASKEKVEKFSLQIPIKQNGEFDLEAQKAIAKKYKKIEQVKKSLSEELDKMLKMEVDYE